jgi:hypothetical protein
VSVLIFNHRPLDRRPIGRWLRESGDLVMVTTRSAMTASSPGERALFAAIVPVEDYTSLRVQRAGWRLARAWEPDAVASSCEHDLIRAAVLRELRGLNGQHVVSALAYRDKFRMRQAAVSGGLRVPDFEAVRIPADVLAFAERRGFPVVLKPRLGTGTAGIRVVWSAKALPSRTGWLPRDGLGRLLVEEYVDAPLYHVDGVSLGGKVIHCWPSRYSGGALEDIARGRPRTGVMLGTDDPVRPVLQDFAARVIAAFPSGDTGFGFHLEVWVPADGVPVLCEVTSRVAPEVVAAAYERAFGVNLFEESFRAQTGLPLRLVSQPARPGCYTGWVCFLTEAGTFIPPSTAGRPPTAFFETALEPGSDCARAQTVTDVAARAVVEGACAEDAGRRLRDLAGWWDASRPWR